MCNTSWIRRATLMLAALLVAGCARWPDSPPLLPYSRPAPKPTPKPAAKPPAKTPAKPVSRTNAVSHARTEAAKAAEVESRAEVLARYAAGVAAEAQGNLPQALSEYLEAARQDPGNEPLVLEVAMRLLQARQVEQALDLLQKCAARTNASSLILGHLGWLSAQTGRTNEALAASQRAWQLAPTNFLACRTLVTYYLEQKQPEKARPYLETAARQKVDAVYDVDLAELMLVYNRNCPAAQQIPTNQILQVLGRSRNALADNPVYRVKLAEMYEAAGDTQTALAMYVELLEVFAEAPPVRDGLRAKLADLYLKGGQRRQAMSQLEAFLKDHPRNAQVWYILGQLAFQERQFAQAGEWLRQAIRLNPDNEPAYYEAVGAFLSTNKVAEAFEVLDLARKRFPASFTLEYFTGLAHARKEDFASALKAYTAAEVMAGATDPERLNAGFYFQVGVACERLKRFEEAATYFKKAIALEPDFAEALNYLGYMWAEQGIHLQEARELLERALKLEPKNAAFLDSMGWIYFKLGDLERARSLVEQAIALSEKPDATLHDHLGDIYAALKLWDKARAEWQKALEIEPNEEIKKKLEAAPHS
ncbi:MAG: tetratricopeptide repeat protein [Verrucomicrobiae bacterium]|nr:tetratricopeptide repeat protein [Verrucomicrobiae bacterium]